MRAGGERAALTLLAGSLWSPLEAAPAVEGATALSGLLNLITDRRGASRLLVFHW